MIFRALLVAALVVLSACNTHLPTRTDRPFTGQFGISVPVPPPSLKAAPVQYVEVQGNLEVEAPTLDTRVFLYERSGARGYFVYADQFGDFELSAVKIDLTDNCLEVWFEEPGPDGPVSQHRFYVADIDEDDASVVTMEQADEC
ncbi:hypothetical protein OV203_38870 [Nannocystis sp. ILAH1]|uniref:hypothetical protein n=1 Tax=unclassified Nannocystis TaxID=2627009 RepID=UPI00226F8D22|nr:MULTISPECIES: hypothetical protein [unclassified Nannocystis]MCY0993167.1 hypothetical protein [Nannocystis sp. ILAH1]MCY1063400.1 hypothetical protein [Nannocystis sp. RBIL2]